MTRRATPTTVRRVAEAADALAAVERRAREDRAGDAARCASLTDYGAALAELRAAVAAEPLVAVPCAPCSTPTDWEMTTAGRGGWVCTA